MGVAQESTEVQEEAAGPNKREPMVFAALFFFCKQNKF